MAPSPEAIKEAEKLIDSVGVVIECGCPAGELNSFNSELIKYASEHGKTIIKSLSELAEAEL